MISLNGPSQSLPELEDQAISRFYALRDKPIQINVKIPKSAIIKSDHGFLIGDDYFFIFNIYLNDLLKYLNLNSMRVSGSSVYEILGLKKSHSDLDLKFSDVEDCALYTHRVVIFLTERFIEHFENPCPNFDFLKRAIVSSGLNSFKKEENQYAVISLGDQKVHSVDLYFLEKDSSIRSYITCKDNLTLFADEEKMELQGDFGALSIEHYQNKVIDGDHPEKINFWGALRCVKEICRGGRILSQDFLNAIVETISKNDLKVLLGKGQSRLPFFDLHPVVFYTNLRMLLKEVPREIFDSSKKQSSPFEDALRKAIEWCFSQKEMAFKGLISYLHILGFLTSQENQILIEEDLALYFPFHLKESLESFHKYAQEGKNLMEPFLVLLAPAFKTPVSNVSDGEVDISLSMIRSKEHFQKKIGFLLLCTFGEIQKRGTWLPLLLKTLPDILFEEQNPILRQKLFRHLIRYWQSTLEAKSYFEQALAIERLIDLLGGNVGQDAIRKAFFREMAEVDHPQVPSMIFDLWQDCQGSELSFFLLERCSRMPHEKKLKILKSLAIDPGKDVRAIVYLFSKMAQNHYHPDLLAIATLLSPHAKLEVLKIMGKFAANGQVEVSKLKKLLLEDDILSYCSPEDQIKLILKKEPLPKDSLEPMEKLLIAHPENLEFAMCLWRHMRLYKKYFGIKTMILALPKEEHCNFFREMGAVKAPPEVKEQWILAWKTYFENNPFSLNDAVIFKELLGSCLQEAPILAKKALDSLVDRPLTSPEITFALELIDDWKIHEEKIWRKLIFLIKEKPLLEQLFYQMQKWDKSSTCFMDLIHTLAGHSSKCFIDLLTFYEGFLNEPQEVFCFDLIKGWMQALKIKGMESYRGDVYDAIQKVLSHIKDIPCWIDLELIQAFPDNFYDSILRMARVCNSSMYLKEILLAMDGLSIPPKVESKKIEKALLEISNKILFSMIEPSLKLPLVRILIKCQTPDLWEMAYQIVKTMTHNPEQIKQYVQPLLLYFIVIKSSRVNLFLSENYLSKKDLQVLRNTWAESIFKDPEDIHRALKLYGSRDFSPHTMSRIAEILTSLLAMRGSFEYFKRDLEKVIKAADEPLEFCSTILYEFIHAIKVKPMAESLKKEFIITIQKMGSHVVAVTKELDIMRQFLISDVPEIFLIGYEITEAFIQRAKEPETIAKGMLVLKNFVFARTENGDKIEELFLSLSAKLLKSEPICSNIAPDEKGKLTLRIEFINDIDEMLVKNPVL